MSISSIPVLLIKKGGYVSIRGKRPYTTGVHSFEFEMLGVGYGLFGVGVCGEDWEPRVFEYLPNSRKISYCYWKNGGRWECMLPRPVCVSLPHGLYSAGEPVTLYRYPQTARLDKRVSGWRSVGHEQQKSPFLFGWRVSVLAPLGR